MKAAGNDTRIARDKDGKPWAVFLAADYTAEHEMGIDTILREMNIDPQGTMVEGRSMTAGINFAERSAQVTRTYYLEGSKPSKKTSKVSYLALHEFSIATTKECQFSLDRYKLDTEITAAWGEREFKLAAWEDDAKEFLADLKVAGAKADLTVWAGNVRDQVANPFSRSGVIIAITSRMPAEAREEIDKSDSETQRLKEAVEKTGIKELIQAKKDALQSWGYGPAYHALAPKWAESIRTIQRDDKEVTLSTKHPVVFFLNPARQKEFNHGWFTVEELEQWLEGEGPVIKKTA